MKVAMLVEDRDSGYVFLDPSNAPDGAVPMELTLDDNVMFSSIEDENEVVWLSTDTSIRIVRKNTFDFENASFEHEWPIPPCTVCMTKNEYDYITA